MSPPHTESCTDNEYIKRPREDTVEREPSVSQAESPDQEVTPLELGPELHHPKL